MLRVDKYFKLSIRPKERFLSPTLLKGLALALFFHLFLLFSIKISSRPYHETTIPLAPIVVEIDLSTATPLLLPISQINLPLVDNLTLPTLPDLPHFALEASTQPITCQEPDFEELEKIHFNPLELEEEI